MSELLQLFGVVFIGVVILLGGKQWLDKKYLDVLDAETRKKFKDIDAVPDKVANMDAKEVEKYWNEKDNR